MKTHLSSSDQMESCFLITLLPSVFRESSWRANSQSQMIAGAHSPIFFNENSNLQVVEVSLKMWSDGFLKTQTQSK